MLAKQVLLLLTLISSALCTAVEPSPLSTLPTIRVNALNEVSAENDLLTLVQAVSVAATNSTSTCNSSTTRFLGDYEVCAKKETTPQIRSCFCKENTLAAINATASCLDAANPYWVLSSGLCINSTWKQETTVDAANSTNLFYAHESNSTTSSSGAFNVRLRCCCSSQRFLLTWWL